MGKVCSKCGRWKELHHFYFKERGYLGRNARCIDCVKEGVLAYQQRLSDQGLHRHYRKTIALTKSTRRLPWSVQEDDYLIQHYGPLMSVAECARALGRSVTAVEYRRYTLGLKRYEPDWRDSPEIDLNIVLEAVA